MIEEPDVVIFIFHRLDHVDDELIKLTKELLRGGRDVEVHRPNVSVNPHPASTEPAPALPS